MTANAPEALLALTDINTFYGQAQVHFGLSIAVGRGHIVCLLGGNASGKSTTMKIILGLVKPRSGEVTFDSASLIGLTTPQIVRRGIASVPEARRLFADMSVRENILMGAFVRNDRDAVAQAEHPGEQRCRHHRRAVAERRESPDPCSDVGDDESAEQQHHCGLGRPHRHRHDTHSRRTPRCANGMIFSDNYHTDQRKPGPPRQHSRMAALRGF